MAPYADVSTEVLERVAEREGVAPRDLATPLYEAIDPEALDALFQTEGGARSAGLVAFSYCGYRVEVDATGAVRVDDAAADAERPPFSAGESDAN